MNEQESTDKLYHALIENTIWKAGFAAANAEWNAALEAAAKMVGDHHAGECACADLIRDLKR